MAESRATTTGTANGAINRTVAYSSRMAVQGGTLRVIQGPEVAPLHLGQSAVVIGRSPECGLVLADERVSATHVELLATDRGVRVRDLGSTNGTLLGDHAIVEALLTTNATLTVGRCVVEFTPGEPERVPLSKGRSFGPLVGAARSMRALFERLRVISPSSLSVLVQGETGTGKEVVADAIHKASERANGPFVVVDCSALPASLAESALFGHEKGAFTGAMSKRLSPFLEAKGGTIFLDELGELPLELQPKLLRVLADHRIKSVGSNIYVPVDVRIVAATRRDLLLEINRGAFRDDLYFRIAEERVDLPSLRERVEDIVPLTSHMMERFGKPGAFERVPEESFERLMKYDWPGNVRELSNVVKRALAYDRGGALDIAEHVQHVRENISRAPSTSASAPGRPETYERSLEAHDRAYYLSLYAATGGNLSEIGRLADRDRMTVRKALRKLGVKATGGSKT